VLRTVGASGGSPRAGTRSSSSSRSGSRSRTVRGAGCLGGAEWGGSAVGAGC